MLGINLSKICDSVIYFFSKTVPQIDKKVKFVKRESKLDAQLFAETLVIGCLSDPKISLERMCKLLKKRKVKITKQGLHDRFNPEATALMANLFSESLQQFKTGTFPVLDLLKPFSAVGMLDSSGVSLPPHLMYTYKGSGGSASKAGLKIQVLFDYIQHQINELTITEGCRSDQGFEAHLDRIKKGALYLQDLGYFKLKSFATIIAKEAYFISRYLYPTTILDELDKPLDLLVELRNAGSFFAKKVWLGKKEKIEVRLIAQRLSDEDAEKRIRKLKRNAEKRGRTPTKETLEIARWSIYITNVPENWLSDEQIHLIYTLRWQIELFFKLCKSEAGIDKVSGKKIDRILCEIYAKLIGVVTMLYVCFPIRWQGNRELSFCKAYKQFRLHGLEFYKALKSPYLLKKLINSIFGDLKDFALKDKYRKKKPLTYQKLMDAACQEALV